MQAVMITASRACASASLALSTASCGADSTASRAASASSTTTIASSRLAGAISRNAVRRALLTSCGDGRMPASRASAARKEMRSR